MSRAVAEADRRIGNVLMIGKVSSIDGGTARATVVAGDLELPGVAVGQLRAGPLSFWWMPAVGEQVLVGCPGGDPARAIIICSIFAGNAPSAAAGDPLISVPGGTLYLDGDLSVSGGVQATGDIVSDADVLASGISLTTHTHSGVQTGGGNTGGPM